MQTLCTGDRTLVTMKQSIRLIKVAISIPVTALFYIAILIMVSIPTHGVNVVLGVPSNVFTGDLDSLLVGKWLLMMCAPLVVQGQLLENSQKIALFAKLRLHKQKYFRFHVLGACLLVAVVWSISLVLLTVFMEDWETAISVLCMLLPNSLMWSVGNVYLYYAFRKKARSGIMLLGLMGASCILSFYAPNLASILPSTWGMFTWASSSRYFSMIAKSYLMSLVLLVLFLILREDSYGKDSY